MPHSQPNDYEPMQALREGEIQQTRPPPIDESAEVGKKQF